VALWVAALTRRLHRKGIAKTSGGLFMKFTTTRMLELQTEYQGKIFRDLLTEKPQALVGGFWMDFEIVPDGKTDLNQVIRLTRSKKDYPPLGTLEDCPECARYTGDPENWTCSTCGTKVPF
jgi:hypothetical protein